MITLTNPSAQTVQPGQVVTFTQVDNHTGCGECYRPGTNSVKLRAGGSYEVTYAANVSNAVANQAIQLGIALSGVVMPISIAIEAPATAGTLTNMTRTIPVNNCCCDFDRITLVNSGTNPINLGPNPMLYIRRVG